MLPAETRACRIGGCATGAGYMVDDSAAIEKLRQFSMSWNDDDLVDEDSGLTGADLKQLVDRLAVSGRTAAIKRLDLSSSPAEAGSGQNVAP